MGGLHISAGALLRNISQRGRCLIPFLSPRRLVPQNTHSSHPIENKCSGFPTIWALPGVFPCAPLVFSVTYRRPLPRQCHSPPPTGSLTGAFARGILVERLATARLSLLGWRKTQSADGNAVFSLSVQRSLCPVTRDLAPSFSKTSVPQKECALRFAR
jgi:hypothetical protein